MGAKRCGTCATNWPVESVAVGGELETFDACPEDGAATSLERFASAVPMDEAVSRIKHARFERYVAERDTESDVEQFSQQLMAWDGTIL